MTTTTDPSLERTAQKVVRRESAQADEVAEVRVHEDHTREVKTPGFSRLRVDWTGDDALQVTRLQGIVDGRIMRLYPDAFVLMNDLYEIVREPVRDPDTGMPVLDHHGLAIWQRSESGAFIEDYSRLGIREREDFLFRITTNIFEWKQTQVDLWGEAMFAKAMWEEAMTAGFLQPQGRLTVEDRTNRGRANATDERYVAIFRSLISRKADAVVSSLEILGQRLKDVLTS